MSYRYALVGNPNSGKTTLFNALTGSNQHVGNWPGVTVEKKAGTLKNHHDISIQDLPGIYSLSPYTLEEVVARDYLLSDDYQAIINIVDAANLERNLYLTMQLLELNKPLILALNMMDTVKKNGDQLNAALLQERLGIPVVTMSAAKNQGIKDIIAVLEKQNIPQPKPLRYGKNLESAITEIADSNGISRFEAIKCLEKDDKIKSQVTDSDTVIQKLEEAEDDDSQSIITAARYQAVAELLSGAFTRHQDSQTTLSDRIDRIVTNRYLAIPIFILVMYLVYTIAMTGVGGPMTDWVNDVLFTTIIPPAVENVLVSMHVSAWLQSLILDGVIAGVGAVLGFLPQMLTLFILLAILEDCGYMSRIAFILDRMFRKLGLSGKSFIPMMVGTGCGVPGIMATRTIENEKDRRMTVMLTTFIPCGAKLPIIALIAGALFGGSAWVGVSAYFIGMAAIVISGIILKKTKLFAGDPAPFVMELPTYHLPMISNVLRQTWERGKAFVKKAGTIIFLSTIVIWFLQSFNFSLQMVDSSNDSILASLGNAFSWIFAPLGFGNWQATVASVTGLVAKENVVATMGVIYGFEEVAENGAEIWGQFANMFTPVSAYSFLIFNLLCAPCFAAIGAIANEMNSTKWTMIAIGYQTVFAYLSAFVVYQIGSVLTGDLNFGFMTILAIAVVIFAVYLLLRRPRQDKEALSWQTES